MLSQDPTTSSSSTSTSTTVPTTATSVFVCSDPTIACDAPAVTVATAPAARPAPAQLAYTGSEATLAIVGAGLVAVGLALVRQTHQHTRTV